ncbi:hypothetical protein [Streptomyces sp. NPDC002889]|uniref:acyl-CoA-like ligand-binding transcription factor n=1 Tax=Streptomyces sp. NPDC002889 TaxID=3364669 RepID=UPI0036AF8399
MELDPGPVDVAGAGVGDEVEQVAAPDGELLEEGRAYGAGGGQVEAGLPVPRLVGALAGVDADVSAAVALGALVFDQEAASSRPVHDRAPGQSIPRALREYVKHAQIRASDTGVRFRDFTDLVKNTPALNEYTHRMWMRHQDALARAVAQATGAEADDPRCAALARFALEASALALDTDDPARAVDAAFGLLEHGWNAT